jgi:hypothetical protein
MSRYISDNNTVGFFFESGTYASPTGTTLQWPGLITSHEIVEDNNTSFIRYNSSNTRNQNNSVFGAFTVEGNITYYPQNLQFLSLALGSNVDAGVGPYTHTMSEANSGSRNAFTSGPFNPFMSFTMYDAQVAQGTGVNYIRQCNGAIVNSWEMSWGQGEIVQCSVNYIAQTSNYSSGAPAAITESTVEPYIWSNVTVQIPSGTLIGAVKSGRFSINNNVERRQYSNGSRVTEVPVPLNRDYELELTVDGTSEFTKTFADQYFRGGSEFNVSLFLNDQAAGAGSHNCYIALSGCTLNPMSAPTNNDDVQTNEQLLTIIPRSCSAVASDSFTKYNPL